MWDETRADSGLSFSARVREWMSLDRDVLILSVALLLFSLTMQMTGRFIPEYLAVLGAGSFVVGLFGTCKEILSAAYPYPGGAISDRFGHRVVLVGFGVLTALGYGVWAAAPLLGEWTFGMVSGPSWIWIFLGLFLVLSWKQLGLAATFALVKDAVPPGRLARGFASTEVFRRIGYLLGPLIASGILAVYTDLIAGFQVLLLLALLLCLVATAAQQVGYRPARRYWTEKEDVPEPSPGWLRGRLQQIRDDFFQLPPELKPLLLADSFVRFGNGMVYVFFVLVITRYHEVGWSPAGLTLPPASFFGVLLGVEMAVALLSMIPAARIADRLGQKPVVAAGFFVYGLFPLLLILAPSNPYVMMLLFGFSGLRFAGLPAHKALIVGPARAGRGGRTTGVYYLIRNVVRAPAPAVGGILFQYSPVLGFSLASIIGLTGVVLFVLLGRRFKA